MFGFPVRVHWSWFVAFGLVSWTLQGGYLSGVFPDWTERQRWSAGMLTALFFFGSVLAHELAHALVGRRRGYPVEHITLYLFGGASQIGEDARTPRDEFWIALAGPLMSIACGLVFGALWLVGRAFAIAPLDPVAGYLAGVNFVLAAFNLLPGFPLDGGRVLRAIAWGRTGDPLRATRVASNGGKGVAALVIAVGVAIAVGGNVFSGVWLALIGWFLWGAAEASWRELLLRSSLQDLTVEELADRDVPRVTPDLTLRELVDQYVMRQHRQAFFVSPTEEGDILGMITLTDVRKTPEEAWATTTVYRAMTPKAQLVAAPARTAALAALQLMVERNLQQLPVYRGAEPVGLLTRIGIMQAIQLRGALRSAGSKPEAA